MYLSVPIAGSNTKTLIVDVFHSGYEVSQDTMQYKPRRHCFRMQKFDQINDDIVYINFKDRAFEKVGYQEIKEFTEGYNTMQMYVRKEIISCVIENMLPWEDLSIGFQMRVKRSPNVYESDFWYHFTNVNINKGHLRYSPLCGSCTIIKQNPILNS